MLSAAVSSFAITTPAAEIALSISCRNGGTCRCLVTSVVDTLEITVNATCSLTSETNIAQSGGTTSDGIADTTARTFTGTGVNGTAVNFSASNAHAFTVVCNNNAGWKVTATVPGNLSGTGSNAHVYSYKDIALSESAAAEGEWTAVVTGAAAKNQEADNRSVAASTIDNSPSSLNEL